MATIDLGKVKLVWRGTYNGSFNYVPDDVVYYTDGSVSSSYICVANSTGNAPSSGGTAHASWNYLAKGQATSPTTTQGDIIVRGASADERLAIGAAGKSLVVNSSANGLEYGDGGKLVKFALATSTTINQYGPQNSYGLVGPQLTYTGTSASNKLLIHHNHHMVIEEPDNWFMALWRDGLSGTKLVEKQWYGQDPQWMGQTGIHVCLIDIPDTSSHTYQFAIYRTNSTNRMIYNHTTGVAQIIAMEIVP